MSVLGDDLSILRQRYQALLQYHDSHASLLQDLFKYSQHLESILQTETSQLQRALSNAQLDLDDAKNSRRNLQQQVSTYDNQIVQLTKETDDYKGIMADKQNRHPYVAVLIDGDGLLFQESYINDGLEGGKKAAHALRAAVASQCGDQASKMEIVVKVCANLSGLATAMRQAGSISNDTVFKQFSLGFTQSKASFDFIDVGHGKERADSKIREDARWHLNNVNCKMVLLGISHDSGYAPFLDELRSDLATRRRLRILEGSPTVRELLATDIDIVNFNDTVFRSDKLLIDRKSYFSTNAAGSAGSTSSTNGAAHSPSAVDSKEGKGTNGASSDARDKIKSPTTSSPSVSYASATTSHASPPPAMTFPPSTTKHMQAKAAAAAAAAAALLEKNKPAWSPGDRGLDPPASYNPTVVDSVKKRKSSDKFCNNYVISGHCNKDHCEYNHKLKATAEEKKAVIFLMRQSPCTYGQDCTMEECIYGHNCPSVRDGNCMQSYCKFPSTMHPPKTKFKQPYLSDDY